ncbi:MAG: hypothetical protein AAF928_18900 [Myxococcota bacterium]
MTEEANFYFQTYAEWREALTVRCGIALTPEYARERVAALRNPDEPTTRDFAAKYGDAYLRQVIEWFEKAERAG